MIETKKKKKNCYEFITISLLEYVFEFYENDFNKTTFWWDNMLIKYNINTSIITQVG